MQTSLVTPDKLYFPVFERPLHPAMFATADHGNNLYFSVEGRIFRRVNDESGNIDWQLEYDLQKDAYFLKVLWIPSGKLIDLQGTPQNVGYPHQQFIEGDPIYRVFEGSYPDGSPRLIFVILLQNRQVMAYESGSSFQVPTPIPVSCTGTPGVYNVANDKLVIEGIGQSGKTKWTLSNLPEKNLNPASVGLFGLGHLIRTTVDCDIMALVFDAENQDDWTAYIGCDEVRNDPIQVGYTNSGSLWSNN